MRFNRVRNANARQSALPSQLADTPFVDDWSDAELDLAASRFADVPGPALGPDGRCRIYPSRPLTCRVMGIPIEQDGLVHGSLLGTDCGACDPFVSSPAAGA